MIRAILAALVLTGCAAVPVDCKLPEPPASLLVVPEPLPPVPSDLPEKR